MTEERKLIYSSLESQLSHRLEKLWRIFSWCSSILISITGAVLAAARLGEKPLLQLPFDHILVSAVIIIISIYAWLWLNQNLKFEAAIRNQMEEIIEKDMNYPEIKKLRPDKMAKFGYKDVILWLGAIALAATWVDVLI
ncbi:MAG: hypothetical protein QM687_16175 [Ferruginibacter sp.]